MNPKSPRPSRKHILDWIGRPGFKESLNNLVGAAGVNVDSRDVHRPIGHRDGMEFELPDFCWCFRPRWRVHERLRSWWLPPGALDQHARTPVWDLISTCTILGRQGLLLAEAKTHEGELDWRGKRLDADASEQSRANHEHIGNAIAVRSRSLAAVCGAKVSLDLESHYQLSLRTAWAACLASEGIPVALLYLGFTGDSAVPRFLRDDAHWQRLMGAYMIGKLPMGLPDKRWQFPSGATFSLVIGSRPVLEATPNGHEQKNLPAGDEVILTPYRLNGAAKDTSVAGSFRSAPRNSAGRILNSKVNGDSVYLEAG